MANTAAVSRDHATIPDVMDEMPRDHVVRESVPWRVGRFTECGVPVTDDASAISAAELASRIASFGSARTGYTVCPDCWGTAGGAPSWHADPVGVLAREVQSAQAHNGSAQAQLRTELLAIAAIIDAHAVEYGHAVQSFAAAADLADQRRRHR